MTSLPLSAPVGASPGTDAAAGLASTGRPLAVDVLTDFARAETIWRALERDGLLTGFQRYDYLEAWSRTLGAATTPFIIVLREADRPVALLPLCLAALGPLTVARFMGGSHSSYALPVFAAGGAERLTTEALIAALRKAATIGPRRVDAFVLSRLPKAWDGCANPLFALPGSPTACNGYEFDLAADFETVLAASDGFKRRKRMRQKEKRIASAGPAGFVQPETLDGQLRILDVFLAQKGARLRAQGLEDVFAIPGTRDFFAELLRRSQGAAEPLYRFLAYRAEGETVLATVGLSGFRGRQTLNTASFADHPLAAHSPGEVLIFHSIEQACAAGRRIYDLGIGEERYKNSWQPRTIELRDAILPVSLAGRVYAGLLSAKLGLKRAIRQNAAAWALIKRLRGARAARTVAAESKSDDS